MPDSDKERIAKLEEELSSLKASVQNTPAKKPSVINGCAGCGCLSFVIFFILFIAFSPNESPENDKVAAPKDEFVNEDFERLNKEIEDSNKEKEQQEQENRKIESECHVKIAEFLRKQNIKLGFLNVMNLNPRVVGSVPNDTDTKILRLNYQDKDGNRLNMQLSYNKDKGFVILSMSLNGEELEVYRDLVL
jgi:hypothetical protein